MLQSRSSATADLEAIAAETTLADWISLIRSEYLDTPGLHLTSSQAQRLWGLDGLTCEALLGALVDMGFLRRTHQGVHVRSEDRSRVTPHD
jgi:hypothetical protein